MHCFMANFHIWSRILQNCALRCIFLTYICEMCIYNLKTSIVGAVSLNFMKMNLPAQRALTEDATLHVISSLLGWDRSRSLVLIYRGGDMDFRKSHFINLLEHISYGLKSLCNVMCYVSRCVRYLYFECCCTSDLRYLIIITCDIEVIMFSPSLFVCVCVFCVSRCLSRRFNSGGMVPYKQYFSAI